MRKKNREQAEVAAAPAVLVPLAPETLASTAAAMRLGKECKSKQGEAAAVKTPLAEAVHKDEEKRKRRRREHQEATATPSPPARILEVEGKVVVAAEGAIGRKKQKRGKVEQEPSGQPPLRVDIHRYGGEEVADGGAKGSHSIKKSSNKKPRVLSNREIIRMRIELKRQQPLPEGLVANPDSIDLDPNYSSPFGSFFDQFCYKPDNQQNRSGPMLPKIPNRPARPCPPSSRSSQLSANKISKVTKITPLNANKPRSALASGSQEEVKKKPNEMPKNKTSRMKKLREPKPLLSAAEKRSDKYRRVPLDHLVRPPRSPHKLLQEKYASDPWKVIVICMLLNLTQGNQVRKKIKGFFKRYPDPQTAYCADPEKMAEYLAPLGLQRVKANRIQKFSKSYVEKEWSYITELCGVGKYAADAYAIFCAGRATEVVPKDHKLVDYWKYVCFELPLIQKESPNAQQSNNLISLA